MNVFYFAWEADHHKMGVGLGQKVGGGAESPYAVKQGGS